MLLSQNKDGRRDATVGNNGTRRRSKQHPVPSIRYVKCERNEVEYNRKQINEMTNNQRQRSGTDKEKEDIVMFSDLLITETEQGVTDQEQSTEHDDQPNSEHGMYNYNDTDIVVL